MLVCASVVVPSPVAAVSVTLLPGADVSTSVPTGTCAARVSGAAATALGTVTSTSPVGSVLTDSLTSGVEGGGTDPQRGLVPTVAGRSASGSPPGSATTCGRPVRENVSWRPSGDHDGFRSPAP